MQTVCCKKRAAHEEKNELLPVKRTMKKYKIFFD